MKRGDMAYVAVWVENIGLPDIRGNDILVATIGGEHVHFWVKEEDLFMRNGMQEESEDRQQEEETRDWQQAGDTDWRQHEETRDRQQEEESGTRQQAEGTNWQQEESESAVFFRKDELEEIEGKICDRLCKHAEREQIRTRLAVYCETCPLNALEKWT